MNRREFPVWAGCFCVAVAGVVARCSWEPSAAAQDARSGQRAAGTPPPFEVKFWDFLQSVQYQNWAPGPNQGLDPYPGKSPHGSFLRMYVNRPAAAYPKSPPPGSIIVVENLGMDRKKLLSLTVMYRVKGYDPEHNDWYWVKYGPNGKVATATSETGRRPLAGKVKSCTDCHAKAKGGDYIFANDK